ncbi:MAG: DUF1127 domain-containing protein [Paracoccaceae bacterium]
MPRSTAETLILPPLASLPPLSRLMVAAALTLARWDDRRRSRRALVRLEPRLLRDIGLSETAATRECDKPFWRD